MSRNAPVALIAVACCVLSACNGLEPPSFREGGVLILDHEMPPQPALLSLAHRLMELGYPVEYRRYYPHVLAEDPDRYATLVLLAGRAPHLPSARMGLDELPLLEHFVQTGGVLWLGTSPGASLDHALFNRMLYELKVPILIETEEQVQSSSGAARHYRGFLTNAPAQWIVRASFPFDLEEEVLCTGAAVALRVAPPALPLLEKHAAVDLGDGFAVSLPTAALARAGLGFIGVGPRNWLNPTGPMGRAPPAPLTDPLWERRAASLFRRTQTWIEHMLRDPDEAIEPAREPFGPPPPAPLRWLLTDATTPAGDAAPSAVRFEWGEETLPPARDLTMLPQPLRVGWGKVPASPRDAEPFLRSFARSGLNTFWGVTDAQALVSPELEDQQRGNILRRWQSFSSLLRQYELVWLAGLEMPGRFAPPPRHFSEGVCGHSLEVASPLDSEFWELNLIAPAKHLAAFSLGAPALRGIVVEMEFYGHTPLFWNEGFDFGDFAITRFLQEGPALSSSQQHRLRSGSPTERFEYLKRIDRLQTYRDYSEAQVERLGRQLRREVTQTNPRLCLGFYAPDIPYSWAYLALLRGASSPEQPVLLFTFNPQGALHAERLRDLGIQVMPVAGVVLGQLEAAEYPTILNRLLEGNEGYWLNRITSLLPGARFEPQEAPRNLGAEQAWECLRQANER